MPPQPLSKVNPSASVNFLSDTLLQHPHHASLIMRVVTIWSNADALLSQTAARFLDADYAVVMAMFQALASAEARRDALLAAANERLSKDDYNLFRAVLRVVRPSRQRRNDFVHHLWGTSAELPDAMLLAEPKVVIQQPLTRLAIDTRNAIAGKPRSLNILEVDKAQVFVYREKDLVEDGDIADQAWGYIFDLYFFLGFLMLESPSPLPDTMRDELLSQPPIQQQFQKFSLEDNQ